MIYIQIEQLLLLGYIYDDVKPLKNQPPFKNPTNIKDLVNINSQILNFFENQKNFKKVLNFNQSTDLIIKLNLDKIKNKKQNLKDLIDLEEKIITFFGGSFNTPNKQNTLDECETTIKQFINFKFDECCLYKLFNFESFEKITIDNLKNFKNLQTNFINNISSETCLK